MPFKLAIKEMLRNKFRFVSVMLIVALITVLVLFIVAISEGLTFSSSQYISSIDAQLLLLRDKAQSRIPSSSLGNSELNDIQRIEGVEAVGPIGFSMANLLIEKGGFKERLEISLIGVEPGKPGSPEVFSGNQLTNERAMEVVIDQNLLDRENIPVGSTIYLEALQGIDEKIYSLNVVGLTSGKKYNYPSIFVPLRIWDQIRPQDRRSGGEILFNVAAVRLVNPDAWKYMATTIESQVHRIKAIDLTTAYQSLPGYREMQDIMTMQQGFITIAAMLVVGGFFQIQALQKISQVGMLKAIGASNSMIASTLLTQVMLTTLLGMLIGGILLWAITTPLPPTIPIVFNGLKVAIGIASLVFMGPLASLFAVRTLLKVEPLKALGLVR